MSPMLLAFLTAAAPLAGLGLLLISGAILSARYSCPASLGCTPSAPISSGLSTNQWSAIGSTNTAPAARA
ncbi:Uncharacterised protein [Mycobacterium tuberculosis]|nr:Uncharacterised protein [Mycobacterium tuberculosis]